MDLLRGKALSGLALLGLTALWACGDAQSASDDASIRVPLESEAPEVELSVDGQDDAGPVGADVAASAPAASTPAAPASRPVVRPAASATAPAPAPVAERPDAAVTSPVAEPRALRVLAAGRTLELRMEGGLSTEQTRVGEVFHATLGDDVLGSSGEVLLPIGTRVRGRVAESRESAGSDQPAVLRLELESVTVGGAVRPMRASIVELDMKADARDSGTATATKVGVGAAAGALAGRLLGRDRDATVKGAVVGAVAGTAVAVATRDGHATIEPGARIVIRLDDDLILDD